MGARIPIIVLGVPVVYLLLAAGPVVRFLLFAVVTLIGQLELCRMFGKPAEGRPVLELAGGVVILGLATLHGERGLLLGFSLAVISLALRVVLRGLDGTGYPRMALGTLSLFYVPFCLGFLLLLANARGGLHVFLVLLLIWFLDIGAYLVGMTLRGPPLAPQISPKKSISGAIGGALTCLVGLAALVHFGLLTGDPWRLALLGVSIAVIGQMGDLFESVLKREAGIKDSGALLGAHGGVLDRIDSILLLGPISYFLWQI